MPINAIRFEGEPSDDYLEGFIGDYEVHYHKPYESCHPDCPPISLSSLLEDISEVIENFDLSDELAEIRLSGLVNVAIGYRKTVRDATHGSNSI